MNTSMQERRGKLILKEDIDADGNVVNSEEHSYKNIRYAENIDFTYVPRYLVYATAYEAIYIGKEVISSSVGRRKYGTEEVKTKTDYGYNALYVPSSVTTTISGDEKHITRTTYLSNGESGINAEMYAKGFIETPVSEAEYVQYPGEDQKLVRRTSYTYLKPDADAHPYLVDASPAPARRPGEMSVVRTTHNVVHPVVYDSMRRPDAVSYLPYPAARSGRERENDPLTAQAAWYESKHPGEGDFAFSSTSYEPSPLSRVTATRRPGADYAETSPSGDRPVTTSYSANRPGEVRLLSLLPDGSLSVDGFRPPGSLHRTETANEDGLVSVSFSDAFGRTVLLRSIAPDRSDSLDTHVVHGPDGRPVSWQDGRLRGLGLRLTFNYDDLGRPAETRLERVMHRLPGIRTDSALVADPALTWLKDPFAGLPRKDTISFSQGAVLRRSFRGSYDGMPTQLAFLPEDGVPTADTLRIAGLLTRERVAVFSPGSSAAAGCTERAFFYDAAGNLIQTAELSPDGHVSRTSAARDLAGNVLVSVERHGSDVLRSSFSYDARGRLLSETHSLISPLDSASTVITHSYDQLGRRVSSSFLDRVARRRPGFPIGVAGGLVSPDLSSALPAPTALESVSVRDILDVRGDLVSRSARVEPQSGVLHPTARTLFVSELRRQHPELQDSEPRFDGRVSEWETADTDSTRTWQLSYDSFGRLASAVLLSPDGSPAGASETLAFGPDAQLVSAARSLDGNAADSLALSYDGVLLSSAAGSPAEHDASGALSLHPLSGARVIRNPLGGLSSLERDGSARILASCDADGRLISLTDSAGTSGIVRRGSFSYALVDGRETLAGVPFSAGRFVRDAHGTTRILHFVSDHIGTPRALVSNGDVVARLDLMPSGVKLSSSGFDELHGDADRLRFAGKEDLSGPSLGLLPLLDFGARLYDPVSLAWDAPDPLADKYPSLSPYAYCAGDPVNFIDPDGLAWRHTRDKETGKATGYEWIPEVVSYDSGGNLLPGLYSQAIFFSGEGENGERFNPDSNFNMGTSVATVFAADGSIHEFDASTYPAEPGSQATVPEGVYEAMVGIHKNSYTALRLGDVGTSDFYDNRISLGMPNPADPSKNYASGINIHKAGRTNNLTGTYINKNNQLKSISEGCLLIDYNRWKDFIGIFDASSVISVTVSRSLAAPDIRPPGLWYSTPFDHSLTPQIWRY